MLSDVDQPAGGYLGTPAAGRLTDNVNGDYPDAFFMQSPNEEGVGRTRETQSVEVTLHHDFSERLRSRAVLAYTTTERDDQSIVGFLGEDERTLSRLQVGNVSDSDAYQVYVDLAGEFTTGAVHHEFSAGAEYFDSTFNNLQTRYNVSPIDLYDPVYNAVLLPENQTRNLSSELETETVGVFIQDKMTLAERFHLIAGTRYAEIESGNTGSKDSQSDWPTMFGVVWDASDSVSLFANRSESFVPRSGTTANMRAFPPESSVQYEAGAKFGLLQTYLTGTVSLFRVEKPDVLTPDLDNPGFAVPLGEVMTEGLEVSVSGNLLPNWSVFASYAYMTSDVESNDPGLDGNDLRYAPKNTVSLASGYQLSSGPLHGLVITGSIQYAGERFLDAANTLEAPSFTRVDVGLTYPVSEQIEVSLVGKNVTDAEIYSGYGANNVDINPPATVMGGLRVSF